MADREPERDATTHISRRSPLGDRRGCGWRRPASGSVPPVGTWHHPPRPGDAFGAIKASIPAIGPRATRARWVGTAAQEQIDLKGGGDAREHFESDALGQAVFDHGQDALAHAADGAQAGLRREMLQAPVAQLVREVQDDVLDRRGLLAKVVGHAAFKRMALTSGSTRAKSLNMPRQLAVGDRHIPQVVIAQRRSSGAVTSPCQRSVGSNHVTRYNRRLTRRGTAQPTFAARPGEPIA